jgi:hypothetical protein
METIDDLDLGVFCVWFPMLGGDDEAASRKTSRLLPDARVRHFWSGDQELGKAFQKAMDIPRVAWDVYLVYPPGVRWEGDAPVPDSWMHQLRGLPAETMLDGARLADMVRAHSNR